MKFDIKNVVKNMENGLFPPKCRGCGGTGDFLCERCKKYISNNMKENQVAEQDVFVEAFYLGNRDEILGELIQECKYESVRGLIPEIAELIWTGCLEKRCNRYSSPLVLVPMPTNRKHVRERGLDHMDKIAREIEKLSGGKVERMRLLERNKDTVQVGASEKVRRKQAKEAVKLSRKTQGEIRDRKVFLIDDVWTTGASLMEAGKILKDAGVSNLSAIAITKNRPSKGAGPVIRRGLLI